MRSKLPVGATLERMQDAIGTVLCFVRGQSLDACIALRERIALVAASRNDALVFDRQTQCAQAGADAAERRRFARVGAVSCLHASTLRPRVALTRKGREPLQQ